MGDAYFGGSQTDQQWRDHLIDEKSGMSANLREIKRLYRPSTATHGDSWAWRDFFIITSELLVASHYYIGCWQLEVTALFALLWYFDKIHALSSRPNYIKSKCRRFTYIDVLVVTPCLEVIYYMLLIQISIPSGFGTYDMPWSCSFWERVYQYRAS